MSWNLPEPLEDPLWALARRCALDPRPTRMDLVLGVYRNEDGLSPVMAAVLEAEQRLVDRAPSKEYKGLAGNPAFNALMSGLILGPELDARRTRALQTVAGTGALRMLAELIARSNPQAAILIGTPSYANHIPIFEAAGLEVRTYQYLDADGRPSAPSILSAIRGARKDDVILFQGCCHNPTGTDIPPALWQEIEHALAQTGVIPLVDLAYYGLGNGLDEDLAGARTLAASLPRALIAVSCSKAFSLYSERAGCAIVVADSSEAARAAGTLETIARSAYSQPPEHGAAIVAEILADHSLESAWLSELNAMRERLTQLRTRLVDGLQAAEPDFNWQPLAERRGMFTTLPFTSAQMEYLAGAHGIYGTPQGRINLAGISSRNLPRVVEAVATATRTAGSGTNPGRRAHGVDGPVRNNLGVRSGIKDRVPG
ncbi:aromatic amino acid transaminase [Pseudarthrobacter sp. J75]|uniref:amino acid aminotransferase n=1 Tax=unclassified Pseudarthrobacter TaxID=2647000 RepID=UPI002E801ADF|nr:MULTISPECIES: aromatic amino acid transaminase [unclassified Pseudarthrobacter]MEE2524167.1 aromatic amino acid transaminase [Pseudarthrobacter sp. J47]MEE2530205.1 aromatic amino acid transaminase [Pseudarthrobacter sp. J75]